METRAAASPARSATASVPTAAERSAHVVPLPVRVLRRLKPLIAAILRSPLHGLLSRDILLMTWTGRRSGKAHTLPLSYVRSGSRLYLCTRPEGSKWWLNVRGGVEVDLVLQGRAQRAVASVLERDSEEALDGLRAFVTRNAGTGEMLYHVRRGPNEEDLRREVHASVVVRLDVA
jgi:hypothetical protein